MLKQISSSVQSPPSQAITGTVTANAGTNLNTSALALESGGNLAASAASLSVLDDWDETDRAKVNLIVGSAGVDGNSGNKSAATQRVVIATDQPTMTNAQPVTLTSTTITGTVATTQSGTWNVGSSSATGAAVPANAFYFGGADSSGNLVGFKAWAHGLNTATGLFGAAMLAEFDDVSPTATTENQAAPLRISSNRNLYQQIRDAAGNERGVNVNASNQLSTSVDNFTPGTAAGSLGKAEDAAHTTGDTGVMFLGTRNDTLATQTNTDGDYGGVAISKTGMMLTSNAPRDLKTNQQTTITSSTTETTVLTAVASTFLDVYAVVVANTSSTACDVTFKDDTAGTTRFNVYVPAGDTRGFTLPVDGAHNQAVVNKPWTATCGTSVASIKIAVLAVKRV